jgi:hypothetical protein
MPAIAPLEDLKSAQKEGLSIYAMLYLSSKAETTASEDALCSMLYEDGVEWDGRISVGCGLKKVLQKNLEGRVKQVCERGK